MLIFEEISVRDGVSAVCRWVEKGGLGGRVRRYDESRVVLIRSVWHAHLSMSSECIVKSDVGTVVIVHGWRHLNR